jgi:hypothetical protein
MTEASAAQVTQQTTSRLYRVRSAQLYPREVRIAVMVLGACSFTPGSLARDAAVASGDTQVGDTQADDARENDAGFDLSTCPGAYDVTLASTSTVSRYRVVTALDVFWPHYALCNNDLVGATHAVAFQTQIELTELEALLDATQTLNRYYVGGVQTASAASPSADWLSFDGALLLQTAWHTPESEPDDGGDMIENQGQQLLILDRLLPYLHDATGVSLYGVICECDGVAVHPSAVDAVMQDPNNPN